MHKNQKLCCWYVGLIFATVGLSLGVFALMNSVEGVATRLESRIYRRDLSLIVDKDYELDVREHSEDSVDFLNQLTTFFYDFHESTVKYKKQLELFMDKRKRIISRFADSQARVFELSVMPNKKVDAYDLREHVVHTNQDPAKIVKQIPFSRQLKFHHRDLKRLDANMLFICTARLSVSSAFTAHFSVHFTTSEDVQDFDDFMEHKIAKTTVNVTVNRVVKMRSLKNFRIMLKGYSNKLVTIHKVEAYCVNFVDVKDK